MTLPEDTELNRTEDEIFWKQHVEAFKKSGLNQSAYCRLNQLTYCRFKYWLRKLDIQTLPLIPVKIKTPEATTADLPVLCSVQLNARQRLYFHDIKSIEYVLQRFNV